MKRTSLKKVLSLAVITIAMSMCLVSCNEGDPIGNAPAFGPALHGLAFSGWKLTSIEPEGYNTTDSTGFEIQFFDMGQCQGKGSVNSFYSEHFYYNQGASYLKLVFDILSDNGDGGPVEEKYFDYLQRAENYEFVDDSTLVLYPFPNNKKYKLNFKMKYGFFADDMNMN